MTSRMKFRKCGRSGLKVSPLCLGTMMFGDQTDEATSRNIVANARDAGVNFIDTSDAYVRGKSEEIVGRAIRAERDRWVLATKAGFAVDDVIASGADLSRKYLMRAIEESLRRLGTDYVDLYYLHREDPTTPLEETVHAIADLVHQGKIRHFGVSNYRAWRVAEICRLCDALGIDRPVASQPQYNAMNRMIETEHVPACEYFGLGVVTYSPLARGLLTGKYESMAALPEGSRAARKDKRMLQTELREESVELAKRLKAHAESRGATLVQVAMGWVLNNSLVTSVIAGPRTEGQWKDYVTALEYEFTSEDEALVDSLVAAGHPSTPGYTDPQYPVTGRAARVRAT